MTILNPTPYNVISSCDYGVLKIVLRNNEFVGVPKQGGTIEIYFEKCTFRKLIIENNDDIDFEDIQISFSACLIRELEITKIETQNISVHFFSCLLDGKVVTPNIASISLNNCFLIKSLFLIDLPNVTISYTAENIFPGLWMILFKKANLTLAELLITEQQYYIYDVKQVRYSSNYLNSDKVGVEKLPYLQLKERRYVYYLSEIEKKQLDINLSLSYRQSTENSNIQILDSQLRSLSLNDFKQGKVSIENCLIENHYFSDVSGNAELHLYNVRPVNNDSKFSIHKCNLDNSWFDNVEFETYSKISLYRSKFSKAIFTSCTFPEDYEKFMPIENVHYPEERTINYHKDQYEILLQLKMAFDATGNYFEAQKMLAISHEALQRISLSTDDQIILGLNNLSNKHGLSIGRPVFWFIVLTLIGYFLYLLSLGKTFDCSKPVDWKLFGYYFSFIDITHRTDFLVDKKALTGWALMIDYLNKIIIGYLIYQFIAAFRKYGKK
ncbi:hypothetical protein D3C87_83180 [compost metagenome]